MMINNITLLTICVLVITGCSKSISVSALNGNAKDLYNEAEKLNEEGFVPENTSSIIKNPLSLLSNFFKLSK